MNIKGNRRAATQIAPVMVFIAAMAMILSNCLSAPGAAALVEGNKQAHRPVLQCGDLVWTDPGDAIDGGGVVRLDRTTGEQTVISHGGYLGFAGNPIGIAYSTNGLLFIANEACLLSIEMSTGLQTRICDARGGQGRFWSIALDRDGQILVVAETAILRVDPLTGRTETVSSGDHLTAALNIAVSDSKDHECFVTNARWKTGLGWVGEVIRVNMQNGHQRVITEGGLLTSLHGIAVRGKAIYVTGQQGHDGNFDSGGRVVRINSETGVQELIAEGGYLIQPVGIAVDQNGHLLIADPYTTLPGDLIEFQGAVIEIDPESGQQSLLVRGQASFVNPVAVTVVPK